jgi:hypothetical protein
MCLRERCLCRFVIVYKCYNRWELYHPVVEKWATCYKCQGLEVRPRKSKVVNQTNQIKEFAVKSKCDFCGGYDYTKEMLRDEFPNTRELLSQNKFQFCKYRSCSEIFAKYILHDPMKPCLITPHIFRKTTLF